MRWFVGRPNYQVSNGRGVHDELVCRSNDWGRVGWLMGLPRAVCT